MRLGIWHVAILHTVGASVTVDDECPHGCVGPCRCKQTVPRWHTAVTTRAQVFRLGGGVGSGRATLEGWRGRCWLAECARASVLRLFLIRIECGPARHTSFLRSDSAESS